jgi:paired amphipathic helix protein Sin3a
MGSSSNPLYDEAKKYLKEVKYAFRNKKHIYMSFLRLFKDFRCQRIDLENVKVEVARMFRDHGELISGFNYFLPEGHEI